MLRNVFNRKNMIILLILIIFLAIPNAFATDSLDISYMGVNDANIELASDAYDLGLANGLESSSIDSIENGGDAAAITDDNIINDPDLSKLKEIKSDGGSNVYYVNSSSGNDIAGSGTQRNPFKTIGFAVNKTVDGDTVIISNGLYELNNLFLNNNLTLIGESQENTILSGSGINRIMQLNATDVTLINLTFRDGYGNSGTVYNGGAINSNVGGTLNIYNCTFLNNYADTHGGAINIMPMSSSPASKIVDVHVNLVGSSFINNTAYHRYGGAFHIYDAYTYVNMYFNARSCVFINNTDMQYDGRPYETAISILSSNSTYLNVTDSVLFADPIYITNTENGGLRNLIHYGQSSIRGVGTAYADGNWWGDNNNPNDYNRTNFNITNWVVMSAGVSKDNVVASLDTLEDIEGKTYDYDATYLPKRVAIYSPSNLFNNSEVELVEGIAANEFLGEPPQDVSITVDYQTLNVTVKTLTDNYWFINETGFQTLAEAVEAAEEGDVIKGIADVYTPDICNDEILINKDLTITVLDDYEGEHILISSSGSRIFNVEEGVNLNLSNLIFENGGAYDGGLIYIGAGASVEINDSIFRRSREGLTGGAIYNLGNLHIQDSAFTGIESVENGGAIFSLGNLTIENSSFEDIKSNAEGGAVYMPNYQNSLVIDNCYFKNLEAQLAGAIYSAADSTTISRSSFIDNSAQSYDILYVDDNLKAEYNLFVENPVNDVIDVYLNSQNNVSLEKNYWGTNSKPDSTKTNVDLDNWVILQMTIDENLSLIAVNSKHEISLDFSMYTDGESNYSLDEVMPEISFALKADRGSLSQSTVSFNGETNKVSLNYTAPYNQTDECISIIKYSDQNLTFHIRAPIVYYWYIGDVGYETLEDAIEAASNGDVIEGVKYNYLYEESITVNKNVTIKSKDSKARAIFLGTYLFEGSILTIDEGANVILEDLSFVNIPQIDGGRAIYNKGNLTVNGVVFNNNKGYIGSAIYNKEDLKVISSNFTYNSAEYGGAIYNEKNAEIIDSYFANNTGTNGGAIYNEAKLTIDNSSFIGNNGEFGGAIYNENSTEIGNSLFLKNHADNGGAIYSQDGDLTVSYSVFDGNTAEKGINVAGNVMTLENNYWGSIDYSNLVYNISSDEAFEPGYDFKFTITGDNEIAFDGVCEYLIELSSPNGDASLLRDYNVTISTILNNAINLTSFNINQGSAILKYTANNEIGDETITISDLSGAVAKFNIKVGSLETYLDVEDKSIYYGDKEYLDIYLRDSNDNALPNHVVSYIISNSTASLPLISDMTDSKGKISIDLSEFAIGSYSIFAAFDGGENYMSSNKTVTVNVLEIPTSIIAEDMSISYMDGSSLIIDLMDVYNQSIANKTLLVSVNDGVNVTNASYDTDDLGQVSIPLDFLPGNYIIDISLRDDGIYMANEKSINVFVDKMQTSIAVEDMEINYNSTGDMIIKFTDSNGLPISNAQLLIDIKDNGGNSIDLSGLGLGDLITDDSGIINKTIGLGIGKYDAFVSFEGNDLYYPSNGSFVLEVVKMPVFITANTVIFYDLEENSLIASLKDLNDNGIKGKSLIINVQDESGAIVKTINTVTGENGEISELLSLSQGIYNITYFFMGDSEYSSAGLTVSLNVLPSIRPVIEVEDLSIYPNESISATLKDANGNPVIAENLFFEIISTSDGSSVSSCSNITDSNGKASISVDLEKGEYILSIDFVGNDYLASANKTVSLKVLSNDTDTNDTNGTEPVGPGNGTDTNDTNGTEPVGPGNGTDTNGTNGTEPVGPGNGTDTNGTNGTEPVGPGNGTDIPDAANIRDAKVIQELIDNATDGAVIDLGNYTYVNASNININKNITLLGGENTTIVSSGNGGAIFNILPVSRGVESVKVDGINFAVNSGDVLFKAKAENDTNPRAISNPNINITGISLEEVNDDVVPESIVVLELESERGILAPTNEINICGNDLIVGVEQFRFTVTDFNSLDGTEIPIGGNILDKKASVIVYEDMTTYAFDSNLDGRIGKYFEVKLTDEAGNPLANKPIQIGFNGKIYNRTTNETGGAKLQINLGYIGTYTFAVAFLGDEEYNASFVVAKIQVNAQKAKLTTSSKTYKASAKTKSLTATFKTIAGNPIKGKKVSFTVNGKTYTATTNAKAVATVKVSLSKKGTYSFTAKFAGDNKYASTSAKGTLKLN